MSARFRSFFQITSFNLAWQNFWRGNNKQYCLEIRTIAKRQIATAAAGGAGAAVDALPCFMQTKGQIIQQQ